MGNKRNKNVFRRRTKNTSSLSVIMELLRDNQSLLGQQILCCLEYEDYTTLRNLDWFPSDGIDGFHAYNFIKKLPSSVFKTEWDLDSEALKKFKDSERECLVTNYRVKTGSVRQAPLYYASKLIHDILGPFSEQEWLLRSHTGSHAAVNASGVNANRLFHHKEMTVYKGSYSIRDRLYDLPCMRGVRLTEVAGANLSFVPKTFKTVRSIGIEPSLNQFFQLGLGDMVRERLLSQGITLRKQSMNQKRVKTHHKKPICTIDLSAASDTISLELVKELLPPDWYSALEECRVPVFTYKGETIHLQKMSGMGNGFTFPIQTLIFYALSKAAQWTQHCNGRVTVYGDDIIAPEKSYGVIAEVLSEYGFLLNSKKSYGSGPFRESCGMQIYAGKVLRPINFKTETLEDTELYRILNTIMAQAAELYNFILLDKTYRSMYSTVLKHVTKSARKITIPPISDNASLFEMRITNVALCDPRAKTFHKTDCTTETWEGQSWKVFKPKTKELFPSLAKKHNSSIMNVKRDYLFAVRRYLLYKVATADFEVDDSCDESESRELMNRNFGSSSLEVHALKKDVGAVENFSVRSLVAAFTMQSIFIPNQFTRPGVIWG